MSYRPRIEEDDTNRDLKYGLVEGGLEWVEMLNDGNITRAVQILMSCLRTYLLLRLLDRQDMLQSLSDR